MNTNIQTEPKARMRVTPEELELIRVHFQDEKVLLALRKFFLPSIDGTEPLGQAVDLWMTVPIKELSPEQAYHQLIARNFIIGHIESKLVELSVIANSKSPTPVKSDR